LRFLRFFSEIAFDSAKQSAGWIRSAHVKTELEIAFIDFSSHFSVDSFGHSRGLGLQAVGWREEVKIIDL
jgi:hypothetical protein